MPKLPSQCPSCGHSLDVTRLSCPGCETNLEGRFELPEMLRLGPEDQAFVLAFLLAGGSLKDLGEELQQSYPTVRNRLNDVIGRLKAQPSPGDAERKKVLDALAKGDLTVKEATRRLKEVK
jgi:hypothetical protein